MSREGEQKIAGNLFSELTILIQNDVPSKKIYSEVCKIAGKKIPYQSATLYVYNEKKKPFYKFW